MKNPARYVCDVCSVETREASGWYIVFLRLTCKPEVNTFCVIPWHEATAGDQLVVQKHVCGQQCAHLLLGRFMESGHLEAPTGPRSEPIDAPRMEQVLQAQCDLLMKRLAYSDSMRERLFVLYSGNLAGLLRELKIRVEAREVVDAKEQGDGDDSGFTGAVSSDWVAALGHSPAAAGSDQPGAVGSVGVSSRGVTEDAANDPVQR